MPNAAACHPLPLLSGRTTPWYDDPMNIRESLGDYVTFYALMRARREAFERTKATTGESFPEVFAEWMVLDGRLWLDAQGSANPWAERDDLPPEFIRTFREIWRGAGSVMPKDVFFQHLKCWNEDAKTNGMPHVFVSYALGERLPIPSVPCPYCHDSWTVEDVLDTNVGSSGIVEIRPTKAEIGRPLSELWKRFENRSDGLFIPVGEVAVRNPKFADPTAEPHTDAHHGRRCFKNHKSAGEYVLQKGDLAWFQKLIFAHGRCERERRNLDTKKWFVRAFKEAGYQSAKFAAKPSGYHSGCSDWYDVSTEVGTVEIGWRKRVVHIGTQGLRVPVRPNRIFNKEDVTKSATYVHAWTDEKLVEYLRAIRKATTKGIASKTA